MGLTVPLKENEFISGLKVYNDQKKNIYICILVNKWLMVWLINVKIHNK